MLTLRDCLMFCLWLVATCTASTSVAKDIFVDVGRVAEHGVVVAEVNLTEAVKYCAIESADIDRLRASLVSDGAEVPLQFVPVPDFDTQSNVRGTLVLQLASNQPQRIKLSFDGTPSQFNDHASSFSGEVSTAFYRVVHDASKQGGLPSSIDFPKTGKHLESFGWNDRVHSRDRGSFVLARDAEASVTQVGQGTLATVIRVQGDYLSSPFAVDQPHPTAVYDWYYFHDLPLVYVTALATQTQIEHWDETHFLELNYADDGFTQWVGGNPLRSGTLEPETRSLQFNDWATMHDNENAIGMLDCGRITLYDHDGANYLQSHTDKAWQPWDSAKTRWSAWLWIDSANDVAKQMESAKANLPTMAETKIVVEPLETQIATARKLRSESNAEQQLQWKQLVAAEQLVKQNRFGAAAQLIGAPLPAGWLAITAGQLGIVFERFEQGAGVLSMADLSSHSEFLSSNPIALFEITLRNRESGELRHVKADTGWQEVTLAKSDSAEQYDLHWSHPSDSTLAGLEVVVNVLPSPSTDSLDWQLSVTCESDVWALWRAKFPQLALAPLDENTQLFVPQAAGKVESNAWHRRMEFGGPYPSGWITMPYFAAYAQDQSTGLYVGYHDRWASTKDLKALTRSEHGDVALSFDCPAINMGQPNAEFHIDGHVRTQRMQGDWFEAATIYRDWVREEAEWFPELSENGREDTPLWMRELSVWTMGGGDPKTGLPILQEFAEKMQLPVGFHWYNWHAIPFDNDYPHYFPPDEGFSDAVKLLQQKNIFVMPYINGRLWDSHDRGSEDYQFSSLALPATTKDEGGHPYLESYSSQEADGKKVELAVMCPSTALWQDTMRETVLKLMNDCEVRGVYIDQIAAAKPELCFSTEHGHPLGGGHWWTQSYWKMLEQIRREMPADRILTTECNADPYIKSFDGYLTWHWQYDGQVPAFAAVYGGAIQMFGRAYRQGPSKDLALRMKAAQQLVFGEQIGWIDPGVVREPENFEFLKQIVHLRHKLRRYFYAGQMEKPLQLDGEIPNVTADWQWLGEWPVTTPAVMSGVWHLPGEKRAVVLFANVSKEPIEIHFELPEWLEGRSVTKLNFEIVKPFTPPQHRELNPAELQRLVLEPESAQAWEFSAD